MTAITEIKPAASTIEVLIVDDIDANRAVMTRRLEMMSYSVSSVESGAEALLHLSHTKPDMILLDYMMPQMNGIDVLHRVRSNPETQKLPVIMVTARAESEATVEALRAGADDFVTKPIDYEVLKARIESHISRKCNASDLEHENEALDERATMRSLVVADLEQDLRQEIEKRAELEEKLASLSVDQCSGDRGGDHAGRLTKLLEQIESKHSALSSAVSQNQIPPLLDVLEVRKLISEAVQVLNK